jgi:hypothetical protein
MRFLTLLTIFVLNVFGTALADDKHFVFKSLNSSLPWYGNNRERLNEFMTNYGIGSKDYNKHDQPVAVFDWDNTVIKKDIGDGTFFWLINNGKILQPPNKDWTLTTKWMVPAGYTALNAACDSIAESGKPLPTNTLAGHACADQIVNTYYYETLDGSTPPTSTTTAWTLPNYQKQTVNSWGWLATLTAGYTPVEVNAFARSAFTENTNNPIDTTQSVGSRSGFDYWIRIYDQIHDLISSLQHNGFDVWVSTASSQHVVEEVAADVGIPKDHVMGVSVLLSKKHGYDKGRLTYHLEGCGPYDDNSDQIITYDAGKRCFINKRIFGIEGDTQLNPSTAPNAQLFSAGDSDTDVSFVQDATILKLVLNRNKVQLMCNGYNGYNIGHNDYLLNPMFIEPKGHKSSAYPCTTQPDFPKHGESSHVIVDEDDVPFPVNYTDSVFA